MNTIPIVLTFDRNMILPAGVCISSMLMSAHVDTFYDIFVLYSGEVPEVVGIEKIKASYPNFNIHYRPVIGFFDEAYEVRGITKAAYYRLLAPILVPEYDRVIYTDVDIIYKNDLWDVYNVDLGDCYVAGVPAVGMLSSQDGKEHLHKIGLESYIYIVSGFLVMNLASLREDNLVPSFIERGKDNYKFQDQDILNITCKGRICILDSSISLGVSAVNQILTQSNPNASPYLTFSAKTAINECNLHYNGVKPWQDWCPMLDQWWECYRKSPIFDEQLYFNFFYTKLDYLDQLSLLKRIKVLIRFFIVGKKKSYKII